jgi:hypothetical protein
LKPHPAAVADREHPAGWTAILQPPGLDRQHQPRPVIDLDTENVHVGNVEDRIGSSHRAPEPHIE